MVINYNKTQILSPLENGYPHIFEELKNEMLNQSNGGNQIRIVTQSEGFPIENVELLNTPDEVNQWFRNYEF